MGLFDRKSRIPNIAVNMSNVVLPLDMALQLVFRQQQQIYTKLNELEGQIGVGEQVATQMAEHYAHLHKDVIELQQVLEGAAKHPVEKVDDATDEREHKKDERPN